MIAPRLFSKGFFFVIDKIGSRNDAALFRLQANIQSCFYIYGTKMGCAILAKGDGHKKSNSAHSQFFTNQVKNYRTIHILHLLC